MCRGIIIYYREYAFAFLRDLFNLHLYPPLLQSKIRGCHEKRLTYLQSDKRKLQENSLGVNAQSVLPKASLCSAGIHMFDNRYSMQDLYLSLSILKQKVSSVAASFAISEFAGE